MIEINLLPQEELKIVSKKFGIELSYFLYIIPLIFAGLIFIHIFLTALGIIKSQQLRVLNSKWQSLGPDRKKLEEYKKEYAVLSADGRLSQQLNTQKINWSEKLNKLSLNLPAGIWFNEITVTAKDLTLKCSVISLQKEEMILINKFMNNLKNDVNFIKDFNALELGSVQQRIISGYDIVDFVLAGTLKQK